MRGSQYFLMCASTLRAACSWLGSEAAKKWPMSLAIRTRYSLCIVSVLRTDQSRWMRINHMLMFTREPDQRQPSALRQSNGEGCGCRNSGQEAATDERGFLDHLITCATGDQEPPLRNIFLFAHQG